MVKIWANSVTRVKSHEPINFTTVFEAKSTAVGQLLYTHFLVSKIHEKVVLQNILLIKRYSFSHYLAKYKQIVDF